MITSKKELVDYLEQDARNYPAVSGKLGVKALLLNRLFCTPISDQSMIWKYIKTLRYCEYYQNTRSDGLCVGGGRIFKTLRYLYYLHRLRRYSRITGFQIPPNTVDKGLTIYHWGPLIVNGLAKIGNNCTIRPDVVIGYKDKKGLAPVIGNNVVLNSGSRVIGNGIVIGDNVIVAPGAVVTKSVPSNCVVAGVPAKVIKTLYT